MDRRYKIVPGMKVALVGYGRAGRAVLHYLGRCGAEIFVSDNRPLDDLDATEKILLEKFSAHYEGGRHSFEFLSTADLVVMSPGVAVDQPVIRALSESGIPVLGELALAAGKFKSPVIAITGTNGKTTVTTLIGELLKAAGKKVFVGGNIGTPVLEYLRSPDMYDCVVLEVSSFQLELCGAFVPDVAVLMNISPDHLDRHKTLERYSAVKMSIFPADGDNHAIMNGDDRLCRQFKYMAGRESFLFFGNSSDYAACTKGTGVTISSPTGPIVYDLSESKLASVSGVMNSAAALLAVGSFDVDYGIALNTLHSFEPGPHRMQLIAESNGVRYINDSKATNTGAVNIALEEVGGNVILIAGGKDKGDNYQLLREAVRNWVKQLVFIGETAQVMTRDLGDLAPCTSASTLEEAIRIGSSLAVPGDTVLLSPASASFDMFDNYKHRGEIFIQAVNDVLGADEMGSVQ